MLRCRKSSLIPTSYEVPVLQCLHVVMDEEWNHHQYAERDLRIVSEGSRQLR
jgi:hypothetical protein